MTARVIVVATGQTGPGSVPGAAELNGLSDTVITSAVTGDILRFDGTNWVDAAGATYFDQAGAAATAQAAAIAAAATDATTKANAAQAFATAADSTAIAAEVTARNTAIGVETTARTAADTTEATARAAGDTAAIATAATDATTKVSNHTAAVDPHGDRAYTDAAVASGISTVFDFKASVRAATTANITLSGAQTIDGVAVIAGNRVLVKNQSTGSQNGLYVAASGAWTRSTDADASAEVTAGLTVAVEEGTAAAGRVYLLTTANPITLGTTALSFSAVTGSAATASATSFTPTGTIAATDVQAAIAEVATDAAPRGNADIWLDAYAVGTGVDQSTEIVAATNALLALGGGRLHCGKGVYGYDAALFNGIDEAHNIEIMGIKGQTVFMKMGTADASMFNPVGNLFNNTRFTDIIFDQTQYAAPQIFVADRITFRNCEFRRLPYALTFSASRNIEFDDNEVFGTKAGVMTGGMLDPTPVPAAVYGEGIAFIAGCRNVRVTNNRFHFCKNGLLAATAGEMSVENLTVFNNTFRADWWRSPYITHTFVPTAWSNPKIITVSGGGMTGYFTNSEIVCVPILIGSGAAFSTLANNRVITTTTMGTCKVGDVIEIAGQRAEIDQVNSTTEVHIRGWEDMTTFEYGVGPTSYSTAWRVRRFFSASADTGSDATTLYMYNEPYNPHDGELLTDSGFTPVGKTCMVFPRTIYSGSHITNSRNVDISHNRYRGQWADQCSNVESTGVSILGNTIELGWDEGITCEGGVEELVIGFNKFRNNGTSAAVVYSHGASIIGNTIHNWACENRTVRGAFDLFLDTGVSAYLVFGNIATRDAGTLGGNADYLVSIHGNGIGSIAGSIISGNSAPGARTGDVYIGGDVLAPFVVRDARVVGDNATDAAYAVKNLNARVTFSNAAYVITATTGTFVAQTGTMSASRAVTLPLASAFQAGEVLTVLDESGTVTATNTIVVTRAGSDTIAGATTVVIAAAYGWRRLVSDGVNKWSFDGGVLRSASNLSDLTDASAARTNMGLGTAATTASTAYATTAQGATADAAVPKALYDANTVLYATTDNTPAALTVGASTFVGRKASGDISAMSATEAAALLTALVPKSLYDANTIVYATTDDTPAALAVAASRVIGRKASGDISAMTAAETNTVLGLGNLATATALTEYICVALSDETTAITTGTAKATIRMPFAMTVTAVRASVNTVSSSGLPTVDINEAGTTILSTKLTIDASEFTSTTAATAAVISDTALADDAEITFDIDVAGTGAKGLKVWLIGTRVV